MADPKPDRTEMWKAVKWTMILLVALLGAVGAYKAWTVATAPARVVTDTAGSVKSGANAVLNRLDVPVSNQGRYNKLAAAAFSVLNDLDKTEPSDVKDRGFRMTNFRGAQNKICEMSYDFGAGDVPVFVAADNAAHAAAKSVASDADRLIRIVVVSPEETLGLKVIFDETSENWGLSWRRRSLSKRHSDEWAEGPMTDILARVPKACRQAL